MRTLLLKVLFLFLAPALFAQENLIGTVGLSHTDSNGRNWAYITWQAGDAQSLGNQAFALYGKPGNANSTANYSRLAIMARQQDTHVIESLLQRSKNLGENLGQLDSDINQLFGELIPSMTLSTAAKLSAILRGTTGADLTYRNLNLLARLHPGVALVLGVSAAEQFPPGVTNMTFEIRQWDLAKSADLAVIGRVTVVAGQIIPLPSPGAPVELPDFTGSGHLNIKMRWAEPAALRRLGIATHGFDVWRVGKLRAEALNFHVAPPTTTQMQSALANFPSEVQRINDTPVITPKVFATTNVANFSTNGDPKTFFTTDNNHVVLGNAPFVSGAQYYYFVTARDLLGRDGNFSPGTLMMACDRIPPQAPRKLRARSIHAYPGGAPDNGILLTWERPAGISNQPLSYVVYRYNSLMQLKELGNNPNTNRVAGPLNFPPTTNRFRYVDRPCTNEFATTNEGFWYVVRATEATPCGTNVSAHSGAAWGAYRDWNGPGAISGSFKTICVMPRVVCSTNDTVQEPAHPNYCHYVLKCYRTSALIEWAEFSYTGGSQVVTNRLYFPAGSDVVSADFKLPTGGNYAFRCRVGMTGGAEDVSPFCGADCSSTSRTILTFNASIFKTDNIVSGQNTNAVCKTYFVKTPYPDPTPGKNSLGTNDGIQITLTLPLEAKEFRLYRSVDGGPRGLVADGTNNSGVVKVTDNAMPASSATICYYAQGLDENGNPGPLQLVEPCLDVSGSIAQPQQSPINGTALTLLGSKMRLEWFCPTPGVDHFEVWISDGAQISSDSLTIQRLAPVFFSPFFGPASVPATSDEPLRHYTVYETPRAGALFGSNDVFNILVDTVVGREHFVVIRAVDIHGNSGPLSNEEQFKGGLQKIILGSNVAWPARELPGLVTKIYSPQIVLKQPSTDCFEGVGIRIGIGDLELFQSCTDIMLSKSTVQIAADSNGDEPFPFVVYRQQIANAKFPVVTGDVVQVTPLIEKIFLEENVPPNPNQLFLRDAFVAAIPQNIQAPLQDLVVKDTQPVVMGARYRYAMVRFKDNHEILETISLGEIEVGQ